MPALHKNRVKMTVTSPPGTSSPVTLVAASTGHQSFATAYGANATVDVLISNGTDWEVQRGVTYTHSGTTVSRGTPEASSNSGSLVNFSSATNLTVEEIATAGFGNSIESALQAVTPGGRLTLESGVPVTIAVNTVAVSGQDTSADTITVTAHGWSVATMVTSSATSGGLTAGTQYYVGNVTTNTVSLHTTVAAALAGTSKVDITGTVTASITATGVANTSIYYTPYVHNIINLWDGANWVPTEFTEKTLALGTLTNGLPYDVFGYLSAGALVLEAYAWASTTARQNNVVLADGRYVKVTTAPATDKTRLLLGTFYTTAATTTEDSLKHRFLSNVYNVVARRVFVSVSGETTTSGTLSELDNAGGDADPRVGVVSALSTSFNVGGTVAALSSVALDTARGVLYQNGSGGTGIFTYDIACQNLAARVVGYGVAVVSPGYSYYSFWGARTVGTGTVTFSTSQIWGDWPC